MSTVIQRNPTTTTISLAQIRPALWKHVRVKVDSARGPHYESLAIRSFEIFFAAALAPKKAKLFFCLRSSRRRLWNTSPTRWTRAEFRVGPE